jgi:WD40 repeat protein
MPANEDEPGIGFWNHALRVWNLDSGACRNVLEENVRHRDRIAMTSDSRRAISIGEDGAVRVWDLETGARLQTLEGDKESARSISLTLDGRRAVFATSDHALQVWDLEAGACLHVLKGHTDSVRSVSVTPDCRRAISAGSDTMFIWDLEKGKCLRTQARHNSVCVMPDGRRAISAGTDNQVRVWDLETGAGLHAIEGHSALATSFWVTPDSRRAALGDSTASSLLYFWGPTLRVCDLEAGVWLHVLSGHTDLVSGVWMLPDSRRAVSGSKDETLRVWDLEAGVCLHVLEGHAGMIDDFWMRPDGRSAVSVGFDSLALRRNVKG